MKPYRQLIPAITRISRLKVGTVGLMVLITSLIQPTLAQELRPLTYNPVLINSPPQALERAKQSHTDTLSLPFIEDFSYQGPYPDDSLWQDRKAFVNNDMAIDPPTYGVATLDGLNAQGRPYNPNRDNRNTGLPTDTLTSTWIDLSEVDPNNTNAYLSFWYQEKGLGDAPAPVDSLLVQVKTQQDTPQWKTVFRTAGSGERPRDGLAEGVPLINLNEEPVNSTLFYKGFQFRFLTFGNLSGNLDHWHLDYVTLNAGGVATDNNGRLRPFNQDVGVAVPPVSLLKEHRAMPWRQVLEEQLRDSLRIRAGNADDRTASVRVGYGLTEAYTGYQTDNFDLTFTNNVSGFFGKTNFTQNNKLDYSNFLGRDSLQITLKAATNLRRGGDDLVRNDTFRKTQYFNHYIAYDDGTPETGFGVPSFARSAQVAQAYQLNQPDTLRAVGIRFNQSRDEVRNQFFDVMVWSDLGPLQSQPSREKVERRLVGKQPRYEGRGRDNYVIYELETPLPVSGTFYIGWQQTDEYFLNVGLDKNYQNLYESESPEQRVFYNDQGEWRRASNALMDSGILTMRPYLGGRDVRYQNRQSTARKKPASLKVKAFPNPARKRLTLQVTSRPGSGALRGQLVSMQGHVFRQFRIGAKTHQLTVDDLAPGLYLVKVFNPQNHQRTVRKLMIR